MSGTRLFDSVDSLCDSIRTSSVVVAKKSPGRYSIMVAANDNAVNKNSLQTIVVKIGKWTPVVARPDTNT